MPLSSNWGIDDHPTVATGRWEHKGLHTQVLAAEAATRGWFYRFDMAHSPIPDTRRCRCHGIIMYDPLVLTEDEMNLRSPMSTNVLLGKHRDSWPQQSLGHRW